MSSLVEELNSLMSVERWIVEASSELISELDRTDPDIAHSARDLLDSASWSCKGLYHRISQLGGTVTLDAPDSMDEMDERPDSKSKIELLCERQEQGRDMTGSILNREDVDGDTREFLKSIMDAQCDSVNWCHSALDQWKRDM